MDPTKVVTFDRSSLPDLPVFVARGGAGAADRLPVGMIERSQRRTLGLLGDLAAAARRAPPAFRLTATGSFSGGACFGFWPVASWTISQARRSVERGANALIRTATPPGSGPTTRVRPCESFHKVLESPHRKLARASGRFPYHHWSYHLPVFSRPGHLQYPTPSLVPQGQAKQAPPKGTSRFLSLSHPNRLRVITTAAKPAR